MKTILHFTKGLLFCLLCVCIIGCDNSESGHDKASHKKPVLIFAAASTTNVIEQLALMYQQQTGTTVLCSFASSSTLARQIEQGAQPDLYLSANSKWMDYLQKKNLIDTHTRRDLLSNRLVLICPTPKYISDWPSIEPLNQYADKFAMGDPGHVPVGMYGKGALEKLGVWAKIVTQVIPAKDTRSGLLLVETGQTPLGLVYATDAAASHKVSVVYTLPQSSHEPICYPLALLPGANQDAVAFGNYLKSDEAVSVFGQAGFEIVNSF